MTSSCARWVMTGSKIASLHGLHRCLGQWDHFPGDWTRYFHDEWRHVEAPCDISQLWLKLQASRRRLNKIILSTNSLSES